MTFVPPPNHLGADLFWWRESASFHTLVTVYWGFYDPPPECVTLQCVLFDVSGAPRASWTVPLEPQAVVVIDSARMDGWTTAASGSGDGVLAIFVCADEATRDGLKQDYRRLYSMVDWYSDAGDVCGLHNDQSFVPGKGGAIELTEIVVRETATSANALVFVNGPTAQDSGAVSLTVTNASGERTSATYAPVMQPFTAHVVRLVSLFPDLAVFCGDEYATVSGVMTGRDLYLRPYVITEGDHLSAYHGGDLYQWAPLHPVVYALLGAGEVNPMAVIHRPGELETTVNLFNTHGDLEDDFWVDARLYDESGACVATRERWRLARRNVLARADVRELLPDPESPFSGHIALTFSKVTAAAFPRRLQALLEYRSPVGAARVMAWSDEWNSRMKLFQRSRNESAVPLRSYYRVWARDGFSTIVSITNPGHGDYREFADYTIRLRNTAGQTRAVSGTLAPRATRQVRLTTLFDDAVAWLAPTGIGIVEIESTFDLANVQFVHNARSGVWAAEHFMAAQTRVGRDTYQPAGA